MRLDGQGQDKGRAQPGLLACVASLLGESLYQPQPGMRNQLAEPLVQRRYFGLL